MSKDSIRKRAGKQLNILHVSPLIPGRIAGPSTSVPSLIRAQNALPGVQTALLCSVGVPSELRPDDAYFPHFYRGAIPSPAPLDGLAAPFRRPDLIAFHSTYIPYHALVAHHARRCRVPYVIVPRGGMTEMSDKGRDWFIGVVRDTYNEVNSQASFKLAPDNCQIVWSVSRDQGWRGSILMSMRAVSPSSRNCP